MLFGINDEVTETSIEGAQLSLFLNDCTAVAYETLQGDGAGDAYKLEFDFRAGRYTLRVEKKGYATTEKDLLLFGKKCSSAKNVLEEGQPPTTPIFTHHFRLSKNFPPQKFGGYV